MDQREYDIIIAHYNRRKDNLGWGPREEGAHEAIVDLMQQLGLLQDGVPRAFHQKTLIERVCEAVARAGYTVAEVKEPRGKADSIVYVNVGPNLCPLYVSRRIAPDMAESHVQSVMTSLELYVKAAGMKLEKDTGDFSYKQPD